MRVGSVDCELAAASASRCVHPHAVPSTATGDNLRRTHRVVPTARLTVCHMSRAGGLLVAGKISPYTAYIGQAAALHLEGRGRVESARPPCGVLRLRAACCTCMRAKRAHMRACALGMIAQPAAPSQGMQGRTRAACRTLKTLFMCVWARTCRIWGTVVPASRATRLRSGPRSSP